MKVSAETLEIQAQEALKACLERTSISIDSMEKLAVSGVINGDFLAKLATPTGKLELIVEVKPSGQPRIVREAVGALLMRRRAYPKAYGIVAAPYISAESAAICEAENVGFVDFAGNCRINFGGIFIERSGQPALPSAKREQRSLFTPKASRVLRVLLEDPKKKWRIAKLGPKAGVSLGQAFNVKRILLDQEMIIVDDDGIILKDAEVLLVKWAVAYVPRKNWSEYFTLKSPAEFEAELAKICDAKSIPYALMGFSAASRYAPAVRSNRAMAYVSGDPDAIALELGLKAVTSGANIVIAIPSDEGVYYGSQEIDGMKIVSPLQAYLDLVGFRGRGDEAAQTILERKVRPTW
jgi:hypothetical protein